MQGVVSADQEVAGFFETRTSRSKHSSTGWTGRFVSRILIDRSTLSGRR